MIWKASIFAILFFSFFRFLPPTSRIPSRKMADLSSSGERGLLDLKDGKTESPSVLRAREKYILPISPKRKLHGRDSRRTWSYVKAAWEVTEGAREGRSIYNYPVTSSSSVPFSRPESFEAIKQIVELGKLWNSRKIKTKGGKSCRNEDISFFPFRFFNEIKENIAFLASAKPPLTPARPLPCGSLNSPRTPRSVVLRTTSISPCASFRGTSSRTETAKRSRLPLLERKRITNEVCS